MSDPAAGRDPIHVLLVDDQLIVAAAVQRMLASAPDVILHYCGQADAALETAVRVQPSVILQDLVMPGVDGMTLVRAFRDDPRTADVPMIVLSSKEDPVIKHDAFEAGAHDYLVKLPDAIELIARVRYHAAALRARRERDAAMQQLEVHSRFIREAFGRYVSDDVVASLLETPEGLSLGGELRVVTILMADLRGFAELAERLPPEKVVALLNTHYEDMTEVIFAHGGTIGEILGDAMLVLFGAPVRRSDAAARALACAVAMQEAMRGVNRKNAAAGLPALELGIGLDTGEVVVGNIGSRRRAKYGVVGTHVNIASRIETLTVGGQVLASLRTVEAAGDGVRVGRRFDVELKGMHRPTAVCEVVGFGDQVVPPLPSESAALHELPAPLTVSFQVLVGKRVDATPSPAQLVRLSRLVMELAYPDPPPALSDVRVRVGADLPLYGKVIAVGETGFTVRYTSMTPDARRLIEALLPAAW